MGDSRRDSRESFAIQTPIFIARQADLPESFESLIRTNHPIRANRANQFARITPLSLEKQGRKISGKTSAEEFTEKFLGNFPKFRQTKKINQSPLCRAFASTNFLMFNPWKIQKTREGCGCFLERGRAVTERGETVLRTSQHCSALSGPFRMGNLILKTSENLSELFGPLPLSVVPLPFYDVSGTC